MSPSSGSTHFNNNYDITKFDYNDVVTSFLSNNTMYCYNFQTKSSPTEPWKTFNVLEPTDRIDNPPVNLSLMSSVSSLSIPLLTIPAEEIQSPLSDKQLKPNGTSISYSYLLPELFTLPVKIIDDNEFVTGKQLGMGGFAIVYKAKCRTNSISDHLHMEVNPTVAIKRLKSDLKKTELSKIFSEFVHEVFVMCQLKHPNVVELYCISIKPLEIILEYVPYGSLDKLLEDPLLSDTDFSWNLRTKIALDIASGMNYLHNNNPIGESENHSNTMSFHHHHNPPLVHRDLRSPNIFISSMDFKSPVVAKVADFGLADYAMPTLSEMMPTWQWLAPEVINPLSKHYDKSSDVYSFGIVLWEIASRSQPYSEFERYMNKTVFEWKEEQFQDKKMLLQLLKKHWKSEGKTDEEIELCLLEYKLEDVRQSIVEALKLHGFRVEGTKIIREDYRRQDIIQAIIYGEDPSLPVSNITSESSSDSNLSLDHRIKFKISNSQQSYHLKPLRPTIPENCPYKIKKLIIQCWDHYPQLRPSFSEIQRKLQKYYRKILSTTPERKLHKT
eukprot:TRINITY_DN4751_c0_g1_i2.p1 TRINITY_DN4751_c0_g1~~TRINITY_DN4751_c0_g1_i2.p1  ORF type:complete len:555 (+),score=110.84 TRINITY_DN4751_c0_g1_i2:249-1913(+)